MNKLSACSTVLYGYTLGMIHPLLQNARLYGIVDLAYVSPNLAVEMAKKLIKGGVSILQLRAKKMEYDQIVPIAHELAKVCKDEGAIFIVNDYPALAVECGADGVHVGQDDGDIAEIRE